MKVRFDFQEVMQGIYEGFNDLASATWISSRPNVSGIQHPDYLVIRIPNGFRERGDTYQTARALFSIFVRDLPGGIENAARLEELQQEFCSRIPFRHKRFNLLNPRFIANGEDSGFHYLIFQTTVFINKKTITKT